MRAQTQFESPVRLDSPIDVRAVRDIERELHLRFHKWDTQVGDVSVLCEQPLVLYRSEWNRLCAFAEALASETEQVEAVALETPRRLAEIGVPCRIREILTRTANPSSWNRFRTMRFDFHPTSDGWKVSEVNTDVPGGWCEGTFLPQLYRAFYPGLERPQSPLEAWGNSVEALAQTGHVALLSAPGYLEDQQVVRTFRSELESRGIACSLIQTPAALAWTLGGRFTLAGSQATVSTVVRFYQLEWMCALPRSTGWPQLLASECVQVLNPSISAISESKRFPLLLRESGTFNTFRTLMPECCDPREIGFTDWDEWVLKACYSNTGDRVILVGDLARKDRGRVIREAQRHPFDWVAQRRFATMVVESCRGPLLPCVGVFVVGGRAAGAYIRLSMRQVTDGGALEAPLLIDGMRCS